MRLLFCCEFYYPSIGGVQEVMRQIAEHMVQRGHNVTVATTRLADRRNFTQYNGVNIKEFDIIGNAISGIEGEVDRYREFVLNFSCDAIMVKAAQQWTFDALWPVLDRLKMRKVFIPCGFSGLYDPVFDQYFRELPDILRKFDHLIFYAEKYRDIDFVRAHGLTHFSVLSNGASENEFSVPKDPTFRQRYNIPKSSRLLLTVGSMNGHKGHREIAEAFARMHTNGQHITLILNGNTMPRPMFKPNPSLNPSQNRGNLLDYFFRLFLNINKILKRITELSNQSLTMFREKGLGFVSQRIIKKVIRKLRKFFIRKSLLDSDPLSYWILKANQQSSKLVLKLDLPRPELVQAFMTADLFVFASNIEYSPLVLFESIAAGTPFLSVPVGNAEEIARWTGGGIICPANKDERGFTNVDPVEFAKAIELVMADPIKLSKVGECGREVWQRRFTWKVIAEQYESILINSYHERSGV
jgi:glycosyltransferase involved in cell wall biosynthesis